jgi:poly(3-hydroxybutyrate) depolymerase
MLHGAGGDAEGALNILQKVAEPLEMIVLAVEPRSSTWDILMGREGPDIAFIDRALAETFNRYAIDPSKVAIAVSPTVLPTPYPFVLPMATCLLM